MGWRPRTALGITHASAALFSLKLIWDRASIEALALVDFCFAFSVFVLFFSKLQPRCRSAAASLMATGAMHKVGFSFAHACLPVCSIS